MNSGSGIYLIAEAGVNHNGSLSRAREMIEAAAQAGVDAVKFQSFRAEELVTAAAPQAEYQRRNVVGDGSQYSMLKGLELSIEAHRELLACCRRVGVEFLSTPFDFASLRLLEELGVERLKISSGDLTNGPLLLRAARTGRPLILSTGMGDMAEVERALEVLAWGYGGDRDAPPPSSTGRFDPAVLRTWVTLLHCTTEYPTPIDDVNLRAMDTLTDRFALPAGYSDHTLGIHVAIAAAARGARVIEKHFTLDRRFDGPDHQASIEPDDLARMVRSVRDIERALGDGKKAPAPSERKNMMMARKSLIAARPIRAGHRLNEEDIAVKRPGSGLSPMRYWSVVGRQANRDYRTDEELDSCLDQ